jgi:Domain of unknown function (DUF397)
MDSLLNLNWFKSSFSAHNGGCVEVAYMQNGGVALRDDKNPSKPPFQFNREEWVAFIAGAKAGEFDPQ